MCIRDSSKTFDNGMICASEQSVTVLESIYNDVRNEFEYRGCYFLKPGEIEKVRKTILVNGALNAKIVGQKAATIAKLAGVEVPEDTKILIGEVESVDISEEFAHEKLSPVLAMYKACLLYTSGVGNLVPHPVMGWGGGGKIIFPGVAGEDTVSYFHLKASLYDENMFGRNTTPIRDMMEGWVRRIGLDFIINTILTPELKLCRVVAGDYIKAHREGVRIDVYKRQLLRRLVRITAGLRLQSRWQDLPVPGILWVSWT